MSWLRRLGAESYRGVTCSMTEQFMCDLWWTKWHWERLFILLVLRFFPGSIIPSMLHTHLHPHAAFSRRGQGRSLGIFQKVTIFRKYGSTFTFTLLYLIRQKRRVCLTRRRYITYVSRRTVGAAYLWKH